MGAIFSILKSLKASHILYCIFDRSLQNHRTKTSKKRKDLKIAFQLAKKKCTTQTKRFKHFQKQQKGKRSARGIYNDLSCFEAVFLNVTN